MKIAMSVVAGMFLALFSTDLNAQCVDGNCTTGKGTYKFASGARYVGYFRLGKRQGTSTLYLSNGNIYEGEWNNDYREGRGRYKYSDGDVYTGEFRQNKFAGPGTMVFSNGDKYAGNWVSDLPNGKGVYTFKSGKRYEGAFVNGKFQGQGTMYYLDKSVFTGQWANNAREGAGTLAKADGSRVVGVWNADKYVGSSTVVTATASAPAAKLRNCTEEYCASGKGVYYYGDGSRYEGDFQGGVPSGQGTCFYANGDKYVGGFANHAPHGEGVMHFRSGRVAGGRWNYGKWIGPTEPAQKVNQTKVAVETNSAVKIWAVIVGVSRYTTMPSLKYSDDDAYQMYAFLRSPEGGSLTESQVRILVDEDATRDNIMDAMRKTLLRADENDVILFYFSGHGVEGAFLPSDFDGYYNQLRHDDVKKIFYESKAKHKLCIADACHAGTLLANKAPEAAISSKLYNAFESTKGGLALLMSSKGEEYSLEDHGLRSGIFSHYLIQGLKGLADADRNKVVTVKELFNFIYTNVRSYTNNIQTPMLTGSYDPNMPVAVTN